MKKTLFSVIKENIECALCKEQHCPLRYQPDHSMMVGGTNFACKKAFDKRYKKSLGKKLP